MELKYLPPHLQELITSEKRTPSIEADLLDALSEAKSTIDFCERVKQMMDTILEEALFISTECNNDCLSPSKLTVKISKQEYADWRWSSKDDNDNACEFAEQVLLTKFHGCTSEFPRLSSLGTHGYLPHNIFVEGFKEAQNICGSEGEFELDPSGGDSIKILWV